MTCPTNLTQKIKPLPVSHIKILPSLSWTVAVCSEVSLLDLSNNNSTDLLSGLLDEKLTDLNILKQTNKLKSSYSLFDLKVTGIFLSLIKSCSKSLIIH